jgi:predicted Fe-S protein YdhL (DUF1289 family)
MIESPCTGVCQLHEITAVCLGCLRSRDEIAVWGSTTDTHRLQILQRVRQREAAGHTRIAPSGESR